MCGKDLCLANKHNNSFLLNWLLRKTKSAHVTKNPFGQNSRYSPLNHFTCFRMVAVPLRRPRSCLCACRERPGCWWHKESLHHLQSGAHPVRYRNNYQTWRCVLFHWCHFCVDHTIRTRTRFTSLPTTRLEFSDISPCASATHRLLGVIPRAMLQDCSLWSRVLPSPAASPSLDTFLPLMSEFCTKIHPWMCQMKPTFIVYIPLLLAGTSCRLLRRHSPSTRLFSSLMHCWYVTWKCTHFLSSIQIYIAVCILHFKCVCSGILIGCGMQKIAALSNLVAYYCIALPVGTALMFAAHLNILGNGCTLFGLFASEKQVLNTDSQRLWLIYSIKAKVHSQNERYITRLAGGMSAVGLTQK